MTLRLKAIGMDVVRAVLVFLWLAIFWSCTVLAFGQTETPMQLHVSGDLTGPLTQQAMRETGAFQATMLGDIDTDGNGSANWATIRPRLLAVPKGGLLAYDWEPSAMHTLGLSFNGYVSRFTNLINQGRSTRPDLNAAMYGYPRASNNDLCLFQAGGQAHGLLVDRSVAGAQHEFMRHQQYILQSGYLPEIGPDYTAFAANFTATALDFSDGKDTFITLRIDVPEGNPGAFTTLDDQTLHNWVTTIKNQRGLMYPARKVKGFWLWMDGHPGQFGFYAQSCYAESPLMSPGTNQVRRDAKAAYGTKFAKPDGTPDLVKIAAEVDTRTAHALNIIKLAMDGKPLPTAPPPTPTPTPEPPPPAPTPTPVPPTTDEGKTPRLPAAPITTRSVNVSTAADLLAQAKVAKTSITVTQSVSLAATIDVASDVAISGTSPAVVISGPSSGPAFYLRPGTVRVSIQSLTIDGKSIKCGEDNESPSPTDVRVSKVIFQGANRGRYFDLVGGCVRGLFEECTGTGSIEYSLWGDDHLEFALLKSSFEGSGSQTMIRMYGIERVLIADSVFDSKNPDGKQTIRCAGGPGFAKVANCTIRNGRVTFGDYVPKTPLGSFEFTGNTCEWKLDATLEVQPGSKNGVVTNNKITSEKSFTHGFWLGAGECPNVKWSGNSHRWSSSAPYAPVANGATP